MNDAPKQHNPVLALLNLARQARGAKSAAELAFLVVNDSHALAPFRQSALWLDGAGVKTLSGVVQPEKNVPYVDWLNRVCASLFATEKSACRVTTATLPPELGNEWADWLPPYGLWLPLGAEGDANASKGGLLFAADSQWSDESVALSQEWAEIWHHAWAAKSTTKRWSWQRSKKALGGLATQRADLPLWRRPRFLLSIALMALLAVPVRLTVLAPAELVPVRPAVIRAPLDGVIDQLHVNPNQTVKAGQLLLTFDEAALAAHHDVAVQALATTQTEYRQIAQQALSENKSKAVIATQLGKIEEKRAESEYLNEQLTRARVLAPQDGIALFDDPTEWVGKPVQTGERVMRIAAHDDVELEAWVPLGDAIPLVLGSKVTLYLAADPLAAVSAQVRYVSYDSVARPNGVFAYRVRATLDKPTDHRIGAKGTAKLRGDWVPLGYWVFRRPLATIRQTIGF